MDLPKCMLSTGLLLASFPRIRVEIFGFGFHGTK